MITGGAGFIGSHIVEALVQRGERVLAVDDLSGGFAENYDEAIANCPAGTNPKLKFSDCSNYKTILSTVQGFIPTILIHCAANAREGASQFQPATVTRRNLLAYMNTLSVCLGIGCKKIVLFSSMSVYGTGGIRGGPPFDENQDTCPEDVYAVNKDAMEKITAILSTVHNFGYVILRPHNVMGERQSLCDRFRNVVAIFMNLIMRGEDITIYGDGEQTRAFSYIGDSLPAFLNAIDNVNTLDGKIINVGGTIHISVNDLAYAVCVAMGKPEHPITYLDDRPCEVKHAYTTFERSQRVLQYTDNVGWQRGITNMAAWALKQGPQSWINNDPLEIVNDKTPKPWL